MKRTFTNAMQLIFFITALLLAALPARAGQLRDDADALSARIVFRDAECRHNYVVWGMGSFRAIAHSACRLDLTARRVVDFHARLVTGG